MGQVEMFHFDCFFCSCNELSTNKLYTLKKVLHYILENNQTEHL